MSPRLLLHRTLVAIAACAATLALTLPLTACSPPSTSKSTPSQPSASRSTSTQSSARAREQQIAAYARQLDAIPPPAKPRYMAVAASTHWQNPFLTVHQKTLELRIPAPAVRTRRGRRRHAAPLWKTTSLTLDALPAALAALPQGSWPYGRVIAIRDDLSGPSSARVQVRRNEEKILNLLNDLGVVAYEWPQHRK